MNGSSNAGWRFVVCALLALIASFVRMTPQADAQAESEAEAVDADSPEALDAERRRLGGLSLTLRDEGRYEEAVEAAEGMLAIELKWLGEDHEDVAASIEWIASLHEDAEHWAEAESRRSESLAWCERGYGADDWRTASARLALVNLRMLRSLTGEQRSRLREAKALNRDVMRLFGEGRYAEAIELGLRIVDIRKEILGAEHLEYAEGLDNLGQLYREQGDYRRALELITEGAEIRKQAVGERHPAYVSSLDRLAGVYLQLGDMTAAESNITQALELGRQVYDPHDPLLLNAIDNLAVLYNDKGDLARAEELYREALSLRREALGEHHLDYVLSLTNLATLLTEKGDYARAVEFFQDALAIVRATLGEEHPRYVHALNNLGLAYTDMGAYALALRTYRRALELGAVALGERHPNYVSILNNMATLCAQTGDHDRAVSLYRQALEVRRSTLGQEHPDSILALNNLAFAIDNQGRTAQALPLYREAVDLWKSQFGSQHPFYAQYLNNLAHAYQDADDFASAEPLYLEALTLRRELLGPRHPLYARSLNDLATMYFQSGDTDRAAPLLDEALDVVKESLGEDHPDYALELSNLAAVYEVQGNAERAGPLRAEALRVVSRQLAATATSNPERQQLLFGQWFDDELNRYLSHLIRAGRAEQAFLTVLSWKGSTLARQRAARLAGDSPELAELFQELQLVVRQWTAATRAETTGDAALVKRRVELSRRREALEAELSAKSSAYAGAVKDPTLDDLLAALPDDAVLVDYLEYWYSEPSTTQKGRFQGRRSLLAFVVDKGGSVTMVDLGPVAPIEEAIDAWRTTFGRSDAALAAGQFMRLKLWEPLLAAVGDARTVIISSDGALGRLPFAALPGRAPDTYLIEDYRIALVPVPRLISDLSAPAANAELEMNLLVFGGVDYERRETEEQSSAPAVDLLASAEQRGALSDSLADARWTFLPGTDAEAAAIGDMYRDVNPGAAAVVELHGAAATEESFRRLAPQSRVVHLATHGFFASEPVRTQAGGENVNAILEAGIDAESERSSTVSGLVLAGANDPPALPADPAAWADLPDDGLLTADELAFLPLRGVELVTMSACETGLGDAAGGEGLLGIQRALQVAGVRATVASLWKVDDAMTRRLMTAFYRHVLVDKQSYLDALRNAQLEILNALRSGGQIDGTDPLRAANAPEDGSLRGSPYYWAAFTLSGDWR